MDFQTILISVLCAVTLAVSVITLIIALKKSGTCTFFMPYDACCTASSAKTKILQILLLPDMCNRRNTAAHLFRYKVYMPHISVKTATEMRLSDTSPLPF